MLQDPYPILLADRFRVTITPQSSKSLTNRVLLLAALANGQSAIYNPLRSDDTEVMAEALKALGIKTQMVWSISNNSSSHSGSEGMAGGSRESEKFKKEWLQIILNGNEGKFSLQPDKTDDVADEYTKTLYLGNAGTATRFLTAVCVLADQPVIIDGDKRMRERPIGELVEALTRLGARIEYINTEVPGSVPLRIHPGKLIGGELVIPATRSSQYISALLQIGPFCIEGLRLNLEKPITSPAYICMTLQMMEKFGAVIKAEPDLSSIIVEAGNYCGREYTVEPDASSATYFLGAAVIMPGAVCTIEGLGKGSLQPDAGFADILVQMGAGLTFGKDYITIIGPESGLNGIDVDMSNMPDAAMTLAVVAMFAKGETVIRGLHTLKFKETDRLTALKTEITKFGVEATIEDDDILVIDAGVSGIIGASNDYPQIEIETYNDHRMAMAFAIAGLRRPGVSIRNPLCVNKTYPRYWDDFRLLYT